MSSVRVSRPVAAPAGYKAGRARRLASGLIGLYERAMPGRLRRALERQLAESSALTALDDGSVIAGLMTASLETSPANEERLIRELVDSFVAARRDPRHLSGPYAPGAQWKIILDQDWSRVHAAIAKNDFATVAEFFRNFFRNEGLSGFWGGHDMFETFANEKGTTSIRRARVMQRQHQAWREALPGADIDELSAPPIGNPWGYVVEGRLLYEPVHEYHYQAKYFADLLAPVAKPVIMEIGGGFGGLAYHIIKRASETTYVGFDLPENATLQAYYLQAAYPDKKVLTFSEGLKLTRELIAEYDIVIMPNFMIAEMPDMSTDLVVNVRSLSEMPEETIAEYFRQIDRIGRLFFFHENIYKARRGKWHGITTNKFPALPGFFKLIEADTRWPRYDGTTAYPCHEHLLVRKSALSFSR